MLSSCIFFLIQKRKCQRNHLYDLLFTYYSEMLSLQLNQNNLGFFFIHFWFLTYTQVRETSVFVLLTYIPFFKSLPSSLSSLFYHTKPKGRNQCVQDSGILGSDLKLVKETLPLVYFIIYCWEWLTTKAFMLPEAAHIFICLRVWLYNYTCDGFISFRLRDLKVH